MLACFGRATRIPLGAGPRLLAIADGMGGHAAGEVASAVAISAIAPLDRQNLTDGEDMLDALAAAVAAARNTLHDMSISDPAVEGMGTTLTALLWAGSHVAVCHIGDSRAYLLRDGDLYQITRDHTLIQSLVDEGRLSPAAAANHPQRSLIMRALQGSTDADPDLAMHEALLGDRYLLCSDGLTDVVGDEAVHGVLSTVPDAEDAVNQLIALAIRNGGPDNITCIVADVIDAADGPVAPTVETMLVSRRRERRCQHASGGGNRATPGAPTGAGVAPAAPGASLNGHGGRSPGIWSLDGDEGDEADFDEPRRRWPVVTTVLVILVLLLVGGLYAYYRTTQNNYYLASDGTQLSIYRGINQSIGWISLSHVYRRTGVPISHVPGDLNMPTTPTTLPKTLATLTSIRATPTPAARIRRLSRPGRRGTYTGRALPKPLPRRTARRRPSRFKPPPAPPKPVVPTSCAAQGAG